MKKRKTNQKVKFRKTAKKCSKLAKKGKIKFQTCMAKNLRK